MEQTIKEERTVIRERDITICDYCCLMTDDDFEEEFLEVPRGVTMFAYIEKTGLGAGKEKVYGNASPERLTLMETEESLNAKETLVMGVQALETIDLCPNCADQLFTEEHVTALREATGVVEG